MFDMVFKTDLHRAASFLDAMVAGTSAGRFGDVSEDKLREVAGHAGAQVLAEHFYGLAETRHRSGMSFNFWADAAEAISVANSTEGIKLVVDKVGVSQRRYGGTIAAVNAGQYGKPRHARPGSHLWIPVHPDAEGHTPGDFIDELFTIISPLTGKGVAIHEDWDEVYFALVESVTQAEDTSVDPDSEKMLTAVTDAQVEFLESLVGDK